MLLKLTSYYVITFLILLIQSYRVMNRNLKSDAWLQAHEESLPGHGIMFWLSWGTQAPAGIVAPERTHGTPSR